MTFLTLNKCDNCPIYLNKHKELLESCDSIFDALTEEEYFLEGCQINCEILQNRS